MSICHSDGTCRKAGVAESVAPGVARPGSHRRFLASLAASTALASTTLLAAASAAQAGSPVAIPANMLPQGGHFVAGMGSIGTQGLTETIMQSSQRGIIDFNSFSIGKSGTVKINNGAGATLDRVTGGSLSQIMGTLSAMGSVSFVNATGTITPAQLTVSAVSDNKVFDGTTGSTGERASVGPQGKRHGDRPRRELRLRERRKPRHGVRPGRGE